VALVATTLIITASLLTACKTTSTGSSPSSTVKLGDSCSILSAKAKTADGTSAVCAKVVGSTTRKQWRKA
jgi:hypothetical protein